MERMKKSAVRHVRAVLRSALVLLALLGLFLLASCPNPLLEEIKSRVAIYQNIEKPDIVVKQGDVEIGEGQAYVYQNADVVTPEDVEFTIWNVGKVNLIFQDPPVVIAGNEALMFTLPLPMSATAVAPGGSCTLTVRFLPVGSGTKEAVVNIYSDDPDESPYDFRVRGTVGPEIDLAQGGTLFESGSYTYPFADTYCDAQLDATFTVTNPGTANLSVGTVSLSGAGAGQFTVVTQPSVLLAPRASTSFKLRFQPNTPGSCNAQVSLSSDDPDENPFTFTVSGDSILDFTRVRLSADDLHSLAVKNNGTVWAWGCNTWGQLGDGTTTPHGNPVLVSGLSGIVSVAAGSYHSVALDMNGSVWAWGYNYFRQLGDGSGFDRHTPVQVPGLSGVAAIASGGRHTLALKNDGTVLAWGDNQYGQLGVGDTSFKTTIVQVSSLAGVTAIAAGDSYSLARTGDGKVWAWGSNLSGQLGNNTRNDSSLPIQVLNLANVTAISAGPDHAVARISNGQAWGWGNNVEGQLGDNTTSDKLTPVRISDLTEVASIGAGGHFTAIKKNNGEVYCLGLNSSGQLGNGSKERSLVPIQVTGLGSVDQISCGGTHSLASKPDGTVWAWGNNDWGKLAEGTAIICRTSPVQVSWLGRVIAVAAGGAHTLALQNDGTVWAWGGNGIGQLGDGTSLNRLSPVQVVGLSGVVAIAAGDSHSIALKSDGTVWSWGNNCYGQLGHSSYMYSLVPLQVTGLPEISSIASVYAHTVAVAVEDGSVWAWGWNVYGQLGDGTTANTSAPVAVSGLTGAVSVAAGTLHSLALMQDGTVQVWGANTVGQLGNNNPGVTYSTTPLPVSGLENVTSIAAGGCHNLALASESKVWGWGFGGYGQLGGDITDTRWAPVWIGAVATQIAAGGDHSLTYWGGNSIWVCGRNNYGQLGDGTTTDRHSFVWLSSFPASLAAPIAIAAGPEHTIVKTSDTWVWSWGHNNYGQLGDASTDDRHSPVHAGALPFSLN